ncbi:MAG: AAA family ATPase, partial [Bacteroidota bacterium]
DEQVLLSLMSSAKEVFPEVKAAFSWIQDCWYCVFPDSKPIGIAARFVHDPIYRRFVQELMQSSHTGINELKVEILELEQFLGEKQRDLIEELQAKVVGEDDVASARSLDGKEELVVLLRNGKHMMYRMFPVHPNANGKQVRFSFNEESDGTIRLLELISPLFQAIMESHVVVIDEIGRSIHPQLLKTLLKRFSQSTTQGQLIFTTHEAHLLDQSLFRRDEIWLSEKDPSGQTNLFPLSDFSIRHDLDIRKGYLNGRFGGVPLVHELDNLNWSAYAEEESSL